VRLGSHGRPRSAVTDNLACGAKQTGFCRQGHLPAAMLDGGWLKGIRRRFVMMKNGDPKNVQLQHRERAGDHKS